MKATAATKWAPLSTSERAAASAANEHDEEAAPKDVASDTLRAPGSPMRRVNRALGTKA